MNNNRDNRPLHGNYGPHVYVGQAPIDFSFRKRCERIDWRKIAGVDIDVIARTLNFNSLQDNILNVAFCDIQAELDLRGIDPNYIKLFQLSQFIIEYLLHSQDYLCENLRLSQKTIEQLMADILVIPHLKDFFLDLPLSTDINESKNLHQKAHSELDGIKQESHKRKKIIATQQRIMQIGKDAYNKCPHCDKAFMTTNFLTAHITKRHPKNAVSDPANKTSVDDACRGVHCGKECENLRERLRISEMRLAEEMNISNIPEDSNKMSRSQSEKELRRQMDVWQAELNKAHQAETDSLLHELKELSDKKRSAEEALAKLQKSLSQGTRFLSKQDELHAAELQKQREEIAKLREQLLIKQQQQQSPGGYDEHRGVGGGDDEDEDRLRLNEELQRTLVLKKPNKKKQKINAEPDPIERQSVERPLLNAGVRPDVNSGDGGALGDLEAQSDDEDLDDASLATSMRTLPTYDTGSLSLTNKSANHLRRALEKNPGLKEAMRQQVENELEIELEKRGIKRNSVGVSIPQKNSVLDTLKTERLAKAKNVKNFFSIRNNYATSLEPIAKERFKQIHPTPAVTTPRRNLLPRSVSNPNPKPSTSAYSSSPANLRAGVPQGAAEGKILSPIRQSDQNFTGTSGSFSATLSESSGLWDDTSASEDELDGEGGQSPRRDTHAAQVTNNEGGQPAARGTQQRQTENDSDEDDVSEISQEEINRPKGGGARVIQSKPLESSLQVPQSKATAPLKPALKSPRSPRHSENDVSLRSISSIEDYKIPSTRPVGAPVSSAEPSTSVWSSTQMAAKGKKLRNSVTFSDDLESTDGGGTGRSLNDP